MPTAFRLLPTVFRLLPTLLILLLMVSACRKSEEKQRARPNSLAGVSAVRLAYTFAPDVEAPPGAEEPEAVKLKPIQDDFDARRKDDRLLRTIVSPDGQRALALYDTGETQEGEFRVDMYAADGRFLRNLTPPELSGAFAPAVRWSPDGASIAFIGRKSLTPATPPEMIPDSAPRPEPSVGPAFAPVPVYDTEQVYLCDRDGFQLRPLTNRNGLIYFYLAWSPDGHALVALACTEDEWEARARASRLPAGRPRLVELDGRERLLDDSLTDALPAWSPDSSKVAAGFEADVKIYDAVSEAPTQAVVPLRDPLLAASAVYDEKKLDSRGKPSESAGGKSDKAGAQPQQSPQAGGAPVSFNPIARLSWPEPRTLFIQTAYVRVYANGPVNTFQRWHKLSLSIQAGALSRSGAPAGSRTVARLRRVAPGAEYLSETF